MKEVDDTPLPKSESEDLSLEVRQLKMYIGGLWQNIEGLLKRVANLEARKPPQDTNPDPEWYS
jgi:hypothetical protein